MERFSAAGRMAFSNYLLTSIITTFVFLGFGFGLYGKLSRFELLYVVVGVWAFILLWSAPGLGLSSGCGAVSCAWGPSPS